jgi:hypothetical protein
VYNSVVGLINKKLFTKKFHTFICATYSSVVLVIAFFFAVNSQVKISFDGYLYLVSANALFTEKMYSHYQWIREPGYPLFIKLFTLNNLDLNHLILVQSIILAISIIITSLYFYVKSSSIYVGFLYMLAGFVALVLTFGYATWILQQFLFIFLFSLHLLYLWLLDSRRIKTTSLIVTSSLVIFLSSFLSILILPASILFVALSLITKTNLLKKKSKINLSMSVAFILIPTLIFQSIWTFYKLEKSQIQDRLYSDSVSITGYANNSKKSLIYSIPSSLGGILGVTPETSDGNFLPASTTHYFFAFNTSSDGGFTCGLLLGGDVNVIGELPPLRAGDCSTKPIFKEITLMTKFIQVFLPLFLFVTLILVLLTLNLTSLIIISFPIMIAFPYLFEPYGLSRYGLPFIYISPFIFIFSLFKLFKKGKL